LSRAELETAWQRLAEALQGPLSLGGVEDIRELVQHVMEGRILEGPELLSIAYTMDAAGTIKRAILASERPALSDLARGMSSFDGVLRLVREQLDHDGSVRDDATPKLRDIRRRLAPLRGRIRERLGELLSRYAEAVQDPIITLRRDRYVIPIKTSHQGRVPGIVIDTSDSGATVFIEPQSVVPMNNELALLELEERDEVRRILIALGQRLAFEPGLTPTLEVLAELDLIAASARLTRDWRLVQPSLNDQGEVRLAAARHPLIKDCVPNTLRLGAERRLLIITGPNAGGKTVAIKTLGLAVLMAQSGLFVAAASEPAPTVPFFDTLLTDIGDEQSIEASLSTYAGHLKNLRAIVEQADKSVLVLIDELGSGTDPAEGAALSQAVLEQLLASGARGLVTTHLAPIKIFAAQTPGVENAAMQFDVAELKPRFELVVGQPGRSYAISIAERLGLPDGLLKRARELLGPEGVGLEALLEALEREQERLLAERSELQVAHARTLQEAELLRAQIAMLRQREQEVLAAAAEKADELLQETLLRAKALKRTATSDQQQRGKALAELQALRRTVRERAPDQPQQAPEELLPGTEVLVPEYGAKGLVVERRGQEVVVQLGLIKVTVPRRSVTVLGAPKAVVSASAVSLPTRFDNELNVRGERAEAAIEKIRDFILEAHSLKVKSVRREPGRYATRCDSTSRGSGW
jgi:DNA mismatch repair protein MutS2